MPARSLSVDLQQPGDKDEGVNSSDEGIEAAPRESNCLGLQQSKELCGITNIATKASTNALDSNKTK